MKKNKLQFCVLCLAFFSSLFLLQAQTTPLKNFPQLKVWLRADTLTTLNPDSTVSSWIDISKGTVFAPSAPSVAPTIKKDVPALNNKAYANFNGSNGLLSQTAVALNNNFTTVILVGKLNTPSFYGHLVCYGVNGGGNWNFREIANSGRLSFINSNVNSGAGIDGSGNPAGNTSVLTGDPVIVSATVDPVAGKWSIQENFVEKHSAPGTFSQAASAVMSIGYRTDAGLNSNFKMAELIIFDSLLSPAQTATLKNYLQTRYSTKVDIGLDITIPYGFCDTILKVPGNSFTSYLWSTGQSTPSISVNKTGTYWVDAVDKYGFHSVDSVKVTYTPIQKIPDGIICSGNSVVWNTGLTKKGYTFKWSDNSSDSLLTITQAGKYTVTVKDSLGCSFTSDTVKIAVDAINSSISLGPDTTFCSGNFIGLQKGGAQVVSYLWSTGSTASSIPITVSGKYWLTVKSVNACSATDTILVTVLGSAPTGNFSFSSICLTNSTTFTDLSLPPAGGTINQWIWDFGDAQSSTLTNPVHLYADTGSYVVKLTVKADNGCAAIVSKTLNVYPNPVVDFSESTLPCDNNALQFTGTGNGFGYPVVTWKWKFSDPASAANDSSALQNPVHQYSAFGTYSTQLVISTLQGCKDTVVKPITILAPQSAVQLSMPQDKLNLPADSVFLSWSPLCSATYYEVNLAEDVNFTVNAKVYKVYNVTGDTVIKKLTGCKTYYWRVRAASTVLMPYSEIRSFSVFTPTCLPGLELWLDASSGVTVNGSNQVSLWMDKSGNKRNATQNVVNASPLLFKETASTSNKSSFIRLDGTNDFMNVDSSAKIGSFFSVFRWRGALPNFTEFNPVFMAKSSSARGFVLVGAQGQTSYYNDGLNNTFSASELEVNRVNTFNMAPLDRLKMVNGITSIPVSHQSYYIGQFLNANAFWNGDIGDIIIYNNTLTAVQKMALQNYLEDKYAPDVNLGADKTVCALPFTLHAKKDYFVSYQWQNGSTADSLVINAPGTYYVTTTNVFGGTSSDTLVVTKNGSPYTVDLGQRNRAICQGQFVRLTAGPSYLTYLWSNGSTANAIDVTQTGSYSVAVTDCQGKVTKDTVDVLVRPLPVFSFGKDTLSCNLNYQLDPGFPNSKNLTFNWWDGSHDSVKTVNATGIYSLAVIDPNGCSFSDTIKVSIDSLKQLVTLGADTTFCAGNFITLKNGASKAVSYLWSTGSTNDSLSVSVSGDYWVEVKSNNNCVATDTVKVTISGSAPTANFSSLNSCFKSSMQFTDSSVPHPGDTLSSWSWDFGDLATSSIQHPTHQYADTGKFNVRLTVGTKSGCFASVLKKVSVYPLPKPAFTFTGSCEDVKTKFTGQVTTFGYPVNQWSWNFGDPSSGSANVSAIQNPEHLFANGGTYAVKLQVINSLGCSDTLTKNVVINAAPVADFTFSLACKDDAVAFKDKTQLPPGTTNIGNYWNFGNGTSLQLDPVNTFPASVKYNVMHVVTASNGCKDTVIKSVDVHASPTALFNNSTSCEMSGTSFTDLSVITTGSITAWEWTFEGINFSALQNPQYVFKKSGNATVKEVVTSNFGCKDSITKTIVVYPKPIAQFTVSPEYGNPGQLFKFTNTSVGATTYTWNFDDGTTSTVMNPSHVYADTGYYDPTLIVKSAVGCPDSTSRTIQILKRYIDVGIMATTTQVQNGGGLLLNDYLNVHLSLKNKSTADISVLELYLEVNDGDAIKETWTGKFLKGSTLEYDFKATPTLKPGDHFVCVYALNPNGLKDELPVDNKMCKALDETAFKVLTPYPNPTSDLIELPLIIPASGNLTITIYDSRGKEIQKLVNEKINQGLQLIHVETRDFASGLYVCKVQLEDQVIFTKFIRR